MIILIHGWWIINHGVATSELWFCHNHFPGCVFLINGINTTIIDLSHLIISRF